MKKIWIGAGLACMLALAGCGGGETKTEAPKQAADAGGGAGGSPGRSQRRHRHGQSGLRGDQADDEDDRHVGQAGLHARPRLSPQKSEEVVVNDNGTLRNAFVWVKSGLPDKHWQVPTAAVELDQSGCMYKPHVLGVMTGQNIEIKNTDPTNHNIHPLPKSNQEWNESQPPGSVPKMQSFARQEVMIPVKCNIHPWMRAYIGVVSHPFFAVTGDDGTFTIKGLPPGTYTIETWHEKYGTQDQQVTVGAKESKTVDFSFKG